MFSCNSYSYNTSGNQKVKPNYSSNTTTDDIVSPVSLGELETWLRIESGVEDAKLDMILRACTSKAIAYMNRECLKRSYTLKLDRFPEVQSVFDGVAVSGGKYAYWLDIPMTPLVSIDTFTIDTDAYTDYTVDLQGGRVLFDSIPTGKDIVITYTAGYTTVPDQIKQGVLMFAAYMYEHNGECAIGHMFKDSGAQSLLSSFKTFKGGI